MTHDEFLALVRADLGKVPHPGLRDSLATLIRTKDHEIRAPLNLWPFDSALVRMALTDERLEVSLDRQNRMFIYVKDEYRT